MLELPCSDPTGVHPVPVALIVISVVGSILLSVPICTPGANLLDTRVFINP